MKVLQMHKTPASVKARLSSGVTLLLAAIIFAGCFQGTPSSKPPIHLNPNMDHQPRYKPQAKSAFFVDGSAMRMPVAGTVARGDLREDSALYEGKDSRGNAIANNPVPITLAMLKRGQERYDIYCAPCHDKTGAGKGIVVKRGFLPPPNFHTDQVRGYTDGHLYQVVANGIRNMPGYAHQISVEDRWAVVAYVRALQRSQNASAADLPQSKKDEYGIR